MSTRSHSAVRNPIASDPQVQELIGKLDPTEREFLYKALSHLARSWRGRANHAWKTHKAPMAAYWKANAVNARHLAIALSQFSES